MALCTTIQVIVTLIGDIGLKQAVVRSEHGHNPVFLNTAWTVQILRGLSIWIVCVAIAIGLFFLNGIFPEDSVYRNSTLPFLIAAISFSTPIHSLQTIKVMAMSRALDLRRITIIELIQVVVGFIVAVVAALLTRSIWSFVASALIGASVGVVIGHFWLPGIKDRLAWDQRSLKELAHFGKWSSASSFLSVIAANGDRLLLGGWLTATSLGHYSIASNLASVVDSIGSRVFGNISLPAFSEIVRKQPDRLREVFFRMRRWVDPAYVGSAGFLFATGDTIVGTLYDPRYFAAGRMLQLLSFSLLFSRYGLAQDVYIALGKPNYLTSINVLKLISLFTLVPILFYFLGLEGAVLGMAIYLLPTVPLMFWLNHKYRLNNFGFECLVLGTWPAGWLTGKLVFAVFEFVKSILV